MRIAVCNRFGRFVGGIESYLARVIPALANENHELTLIFEADSPAAFPRLTTTGRSWFASEIGVPQVLRRLRQCPPDIIYVHSLSDAGLARGLIETAPAVLFAHDYAATCISGSKSFAFPRMQSCSRRLGAGCLVNYYPRRCGGISPVTMWREYRNRLLLLDLVQHYEVVLVASEAMRREYLRHAVHPNRLQVVPYPVSTPGGEPDSDTTYDAVCSKEVQRIRSDPVHLLFAGRMVQLKGAEILIRALPVIVEILQRPLKLTLAGDGPAKPKWEQQARLVCSHNPLISVEFAGWLDHTSLRRVLRECDLLVVPSLWPEPFGMIGLEAGTVGVPTVAFATGGIPEWLLDGINGSLVCTDPPSVPSLAAAISKCVADPLLHQRLRNGAQQQASQFSMKRHVHNLQQIFVRAIERTSIDLDLPRREQQTRVAGNG